MSTHISEMRSMNLLYVLIIPISKMEKKRFTPISVFTCSIFTRFENKIFLIFLRGFSGIKKRMRS